MLDVELLFITVASPMLIGVYQNEKLIEQIELKEQSSEALPPTYKLLQEKYNIIGLFFVNGPGSYMSIKLTHIFLTTVNIVNNIELYATLGFEFNGNNPIKAMGKKYFIKDEENNIILKSYDTPVEQIFFLPEILQKELFSKDIEPIYMLPVVN